MDDFILGDEVTGVKAIMHLIFTGKLIFKTVRERSLAVSCLPVLHSGICTSTLLSALKFIPDFTACPQTSSDTKWVALIYIHLEGALDKVFISTRPCG